MAKVEEKDVYGEGREKPDDPLVLLVNLETGSLREIRCGPSRADFTNGDRPVKWSKDFKRPIIPKRYERRFCFYEDFCADARRNKPYGLTKAQGEKYVAAYRELAARRGAGTIAVNGSRERVQELIAEGAKPRDARARADEEARLEFQRKLYHPALFAMREEYRRTKIKATNRPERFDDILDGLRKQADSPK